MTDPALWRNRNVRMRFGATALTNLGDGLLAVAFAYFAALLTRDYGGQCQPRANFGAAAGGIIWQHVGEYCLGQLRQRVMPDALRGRVNAAFRFSGTGPSALGSVAGGLVVGFCATMGQISARHLLSGVVVGLATALLAFCTWRLRLTV